MIDPAPNAWCIQHSGANAAENFIEGPFTTQTEAQANADADIKAHPAISATVVPLINPANC